MKWINGRYLVSIRRSLHMTQADLARTLGVAQATVSRWESGLHEPTAEQWRRIRTLAEPSHDAADWSLLFMVRMASRPLILTTLDLTVIEVSDAVVAEEGLSRREFLGRNLLARFDSELNEAYRLAQEGGLFGGAAIGLVITGMLRRSDGSTAAHISTWTPLRRSDGTPLLLWQRELVSDEALAQVPEGPGARLVTFDDLFRSAE